MKTYQLIAVAMLSALAAIFQLINNVVGIPTGFGMTVDLVGVPALLAFFLFGLDAALYVSVLTAFIITLIAPTTWLGASMKFAATLPMFLFPAIYVISVKGRSKNTKILISLLFVIFLAMFALMLPSSINLISKQFITETNQTIYAIPKVEIIKVEGGSITLGSLLLGLLPITAIAILSLVLLIFWERYAKGANVSVFSNPYAMSLVLVASVLVRGVTMLIANYYYAGPIFWGISTEEFMRLVPWYLIFGWNMFQGVLEVALAWVVAFRFKFVKRYGTW